MKKVSKMLGVLALTAFLGLTNPVVAQTADSPTTTTQTDDEDDDSGKIGLAGLLGLLGLLGLRRNKDDKKYTTTTNR